MEQRRGAKEMERKRIVVDASIAVKWFIEEDWSREARLIARSYADGLIDLIAPCLMPYEVLNALKYSGEFGELELKEVAEILEDYQITYYGLAGAVALKAVELSMRLGLTIYDASYIALAQNLEAILYTADERLLRKAKGVGEVRHVKDFKP